MTRGPSLVCVPGLGLDDRAWRPTLAALGVLSVDGRVHLLPGFGRRPSRGDDLRPQVLAARLLAELPDEGPVVLAGHSASCQVVAHAAALAPDRVAALVLVGPTTDPRMTTWRQVAQRWLRTAVWERPGQVPTLVRTYARTGLLWMLRTMGTALRDDIRTPLGRVGCPVVVVRGRHDRICPERWAREVGDSSGTGAAVHTLRRGAHMVPITHGALVAELVAPLLRGVSAPDRRP